MICIVINSCLQSAVKKAFNPKKMSLKHTCLRNDCQLELTEMGKDLQMSLVTPLDFLLLNVEKDE